jgi:hypothetical protein
MLEVNGEQYVLQFTIAVQAPDFWRQASVSPASTQVARPHAAGWLRQAIEAKCAAPKAHRLPTVLVIDARHAGVVADASLVREYLSRYADPVNECGFASVWVVGPTWEHVRRVGSGRP